MRNPDVELRNRKQDHIRINLEEDVKSSLFTGFDQYHFSNNSLPEVDMSSITTDCEFLDLPCKAPLLISSMTGGSKNGQLINMNLAVGAEARGIALGLGSQRIGLESSETARSFNLRKYAPHIPIFANIGAIQLNNGCGIEECKKVIDMAEADALILHLNPLQEALQPEGQTNFAGLTQKIALICRQLEIPVIAKEVGWGISENTARILADCGVAAIDVAGAGGTSWSQVEKFRNTSDSRIRICSHFQNWGIPTAEAVQRIHSALPDIPVVASGGLRKGLDLAKSIALGASLGGIAGGFLEAATRSSEDVVELIDEVLLELRITMFAVGASTVQQLVNIPITRRHHVDDEY